MSSSGKGRSPNRSPRSVNSRGTPSRNATPPQTPPASHASWFYDDVSSPFRYNLRWSFSPATYEKSLLNLLSPGKTPLKYFSPDKSPFAALSPANSRAPTASPNPPLSPETLSLLGVGKSPTGPLSPQLSSPVHITVPVGVDRTNVPATVDEMDQFLASAWSNDMPTSSENSSKLSDLHHFYTSKLAEIDAAEKRSLDDNLPDGNQAGSSLKSIDECLKDAQIRGHFDAARKQLKEETIQGILKLRLKPPSRPQATRTHGGKSPRQTARERSPHKKSPKQSTKGKNDRKPLDNESILEEWFEEHSEKPYPTKKEKEELAKCCNITVKQITTWFNNKRYRTNCTKTKKGKGKAKK